MDCYFSPSLFIILLFPFFLFYIVLFHFILFCLKVVTIYGSGVVKSFRSEDSLYKVQVFFLLYVFMLVAIRSWLLRICLPISCVRSRRTESHIYMYEYILNMCLQISLFQLPFGVGYLVPSAILGAEELSPQALHAIGVPDTVTPISDVTGTYVYVCIFG